jgi:hypothetical protein
MKRALTKSNSVCTRNCDGIVLIEQRDEVCIECLLDRELQFWTKFNELAKNRQFVVTGQSLSARMILRW